MTGAEFTVAAVRRHAGLIIEAARCHQLRPSVLAGLVAQESAGNQYAQRYEPKFSYIPEEFTADKPAGMSSATEFNGRKTSWGLCQVMGQVARELGFRGWWAALCEPDLGLTYGARKLAECMRRARGDELLALTAYNRGNFNTSDRTYANGVMVWQKLFVDLDQEPHDCGRG